MSASKILNSIKNPNGAVLCVLTFYFLAFMTSSKSFYEPYILVGLFGLYAFYKNKKSEPVKIGKLEFCFATFLTICITLANYDILNITLSNGKVALCIALLKLAVLFYGIYMLFRNILVFLSEFYFHCNKWSNCEIFENHGRKSSVSQNSLYKVIFRNESLLHLFFLSLVLIILPSLIILIASDYPGVVTYDSYNSIKMALGKIPYDNLNPILFSMIVSGIIDLGINLTQNINVSIFLFSIFQTVLIGSVFSYAIVTVYQFTLNKKLTVILIFVIAFFPLNLTYFHSMWKDIWFSGALILFSTACARTLYNIGNKLTNTFLLIFGCFLSCVMRHNGIMSFFVLFVLSFIIFRNRRSICFLIGATILVSYISLSFVVSITDAKGSDLVESASIPIQQIARVVVEDKDLSVDEIDLIEKVLPLDKISGNYNEHISDPLKLAIRSNGNGGSEFLEKHKEEYFKLYIELGIRYPMSYLRGWIEQTKGFWNAGYDRIIDRFTPSDSLPDVQHIVISEGFNHLFENCLGVFRCGNGIKLFASIGVYFWLYVASLYVTIKRKDLPMLFIILLFLLITGTYIIATPLYVDYRYSYYLFCGTPLVVSLLYAKRSG